jgi:hypothetical protein
MSRKIDFLQTSIAVIDLKLEVGSQGCASPKRVTNFHTGTPAFHVLPYRAVLTPSRKKNGTEFEVVKISSHHLRFRDHPAEFLMARPTGTSAAVVRRFDCSLCLQSYTSRAITMVHFFPLLPTVRVPAAQPSFRFRSSVFLLRRRSASTPRVLLQSSSQGRCYRSRLLRT